MPAVPPSVTVRRITDPHDPALAAFGEVQRRSYYAPDTLIPPQMFPDLVAGADSGRRNRILVAERAGTVLGGTLYHLLPRAGFNSFLGIDAVARGTGVGHALHRAALDDVQAHGLAGMFADSVYAGRQSAESRAAEARTGTDPLARRAALDRLGFRTVDLGYWQPVGGPDGGPVKDLDLLYAPLHPALQVELKLVSDTLEAYWQPWLGGLHTGTELRGLRERAAGASLKLLPATETAQYWQSRES
ncbi:GNAT family N-acetyltransferase [Deinococcus radiophilus]|uniref:GNAT family N-acetyltransferase n=1 Tax=Deinococcus radiophilus TaxID=32062 RepID=A0A3S0I958_9DEIO|nr:GNAT family N-acetyltransferase [Deinococcus radiophilus]RTR27492.1 GNAT family N-acetyltransferase [Deinococcus radiophilus]